MVAPTDTKFHWADYTVFGATLLIAAAIGIFSAWQSRKKADTTEFLLGSRQIGAIPTGLSILASLLNAVFVLSGPAEIYYNGTMWVYVFFGYMWAIIPPAHLTLPVYRRLNMISAHQYFELRFGGKFLRGLASTVFIFLVLGFLAAVLYMPALAFSQITDLPVWVIIVATGGICTFYTTIGGLKAVVWTDALQMTLVVVGMVVISVRGMMEVGGFTEAFSIANKGNRLIFNEFTPDPRIRHSVFGVVFGWGSSLLTTMAGNQMIIQRQMAVKTKRGARVAMYMAMIVGMITTVLVLLVGISAYAFYSKCDPLRSGTIKKPDQLVPLFMMQMLGDIPGLPGLFSASFFSAALSTVSSAINSLSAVLLEDVIKPLYTFSTHKSISSKKQLLISKVLALFFGAVSVCVAFLTPLLGPIMVQITAGVLGVLGGPLLAMFLLGLFVPFANIAGVTCGVVGGLGLILWIFIGFLFHKRPSIPLPLRTDGCPLPPNVTIANLTMSTVSPMSAVFNMTNAADATPAPAPSWNYEELYNISYTWYSIISISTTLILGIIFSLIFGRGKSTVTDSRHVFSFRDLCSGEEDDIGEDEIKMDKIIDDKIIPPQVRTGAYGADNSAYQQSAGDIYPVSATSGALYQAAPPPEYSNGLYRRY